MSVSHERFKEQPIQNVLLVAECLWDLTPSRVGDRLIAGLRQHLTRRRQLGLRFIRLLKAPLQFGQNAGVSEPVVGKHCFPSLQCMIEFQEILSTRIMCHEQEPRFTRGLHIWRIGYFSRSLQANSVGCWPIIALKHSVAARVHICFEASQRNDMSNLKLVLIIMEQ